MVDGEHELELEQHDPLVTEQVHFCRTYVRPPMPKDESDFVAEYERSNPLAQVCVKFLFLAAVGFVGFCIVMPFGVSMIAGIIAGCLAATAANLYWLITPWRLRRRMQREQVRELPPVGSRLHCVGAPNDLPQAANLESVPFEPRVYRASSASLLLTQGMVLLCLVPTINAAGLFKGEYGWGTLATICLVAVLLAILLRPLYFRISPGRLEVLRYGFFKRNPDEVERYDLRRAHIVADLCKNRVTVSESNEKGKNYSLLLMPQRREFLTTLFMAAVSEYNAPELPLDTL